MHLGPELIGNPSAMARRSSRCAWSRLSLSTASSFCWTRASRAPGAPYCRSPRPISAVMLTTLTIVSPENDRTCGAYSADALAPARERTATVSLRRVSPRLVGERREDRVAASLNVGLRQSADNDRPGGPRDVDLGVASRSLNSVSMGPLSRMLMGPARRRTQYTTQLLPRMVTIAAPCSPSSCSSSMDSSAGSRATISS